jgi:hypothetical protein
MGPDVQRVFRYAQASVGATEIGQGIAREVLPVSLVAHRPLCARGEAVSTEKCGCVYADALNTPSVRAGYEVGGYLISACAEHAPEPKFESPDDPPDELVTLRSELTASRAECERYRESIKSLRDKTVQQFVHHEQFGQTWECSVYCDYANRLSEILQEPQP